MTLVFVAKLLLYAPSVHGARTVNALDFSDMMIFHVMQLRLKSRTYYLLSSIAIAGFALVEATLPPELQTAVPFCAANCVDIALQIQYSTLCTEPFTLDCLCTQYGSSGNALEQSISSCIQSPDCGFSQPDSDNLATSVCANIPGAVTLITVTTLTALPTTSTSMVTSLSAAPTTLQTTMAIPPPTTTAPYGATVTAGAGGTPMKGSLNLTMAQIAGITIAAAALLILTVGIFSCIFFVRKRNKRLEQEDRKILMGSSPKSGINTQDTQDIEDMRRMQAAYFPPPPLSPGQLAVARKERPESPKRFSLRRKRSKDLDEENKILEISKPIQPQRTWPRYYPIMPDQNFGIGVAATTNNPQPVLPAQKTPIQTAAPVQRRSQGAQTSGSTNAVPNFSLSRIPSAASLPAYQPHANYTSNVHQVHAPPRPQPPAAAYVPNTMVPPLTNNHGAKANNSRRSKAFSFMTDIEEGEQVSTSEASLSGIPSSSSDETSPSSAAARSSASPSMKKSRRPTLTINIPGQPKAQKEYPPPPPAKSSVRMPTALPGPPQQKAPWKPAPVIERQLPPTVATTSSEVQSQALLHLQRSMPPMQPVPDFTNVRNVTPPQRNVVLPTSMSTLPRQGAPRRMPSNSSAPMLQALASRASQRSANRPKPASASNTQQSNTISAGQIRPTLALNTDKRVIDRPALLLNTQSKATKTATRPPLLREDQLNQITNSPSDILKAANSYARARKPSPESTSRDSVSSGALPSSNVLGPATFLLSDSEGKVSSRSNSSVRKSSRAQSRGGRRASDADSVTSFEDDCSDSDDETPPKEENRSLSPVIEASPVASLRYPKVPRGSNQIVPRSPGTPKNPQQAHSPTAKTTTPTRFSSQARPDVNTAAAIAATQGIGNRLWKTEVSPAVNKPSHRRSASWDEWAQNTPNSALIPPQPAFANPEGLVAPKLTPTRRGDELFLDLRFSAATIGPASPKRTNGR